MVKFVCCCSFFFCMLLCNAQQHTNAKQKFRYHLLTSAGLAMGEAGGKAVVQAVNGLAYKQFFAGIGVGLDYYKFKTMPLFADLRMSLDKQQQLFVYVNGGYHYPLNTNKKTDLPYITTETFKGSVYYDAGIGARAFNHHWYRLLVSVGFSQKRIEHVQGYTYSWNNPITKEYIHTYHYTLNRFTAKLTWDIGK